MTNLSKDAFATALVVGAFAFLLVFHLATIVGLVRRRHHKAALGAFVVPPLAPYFAMTNDMLVRAIAWLVFAALYAVGLALAI